MDTIQAIFSVVIIGIGATASMDVWLFLLRRMGIPTSSFALVGRWAGHLRRGTLRHAAIAKAEPIAGEMFLGWAIHYAVGMVFAVLPVMLAGPSWLLTPTLGPALAAGIVTVLAPFCVMQPAMGAGFFASKTPTPLKGCLRSLANHTVFGLGLYGSALLLAHSA